jgi:hypothetical protein
VPDDKLEIPTRKAAPVSQRRAPLAFSALFSFSCPVPPPPPAKPIPRSIIIMVSPRLPSFLHPLLLVALLPLAAHGCKFAPPFDINIPSYFPPTDFQVTYPTKGAQLANGQTYPITWEKGLLDGVNFFDLELTRMNSNGLILIARDSASYVVLFVSLNSLSLLFSF